MHYNHACYEKNNYKQNVIYVLERKLTNNDQRQKKVQIINVLTHHNFECYIYKE